MGLSALQVCKYLLNIAYQNGDLITNLKMQKLLYYAQAWYMVNNKGRRLFSDEIQAWKYGPVVPTVYNALKKHNRSPIRLNVDNEDFTVISKKQKKFMEEFAVEFFGVSASELVAMTHTEAPWKTAWAKGEGSVIDTAEMYSFYKQMLDEK